MNVSGGAVTRDAVNKNEAVRLLEFLSLDLAQYMYAQVNHEYPEKKEFHTPESLAVLVAARKVSKKEYLNKISEI